MIGSYLTSLSGWAGDEYPLSVLPRAVRPSGKDFKVQREKSIGRDPCYAYRHELVRYLY